MENKDQEQNAILNTEGDLEVRKEENRCNTPSQEQYKSPFTDIWAFLFFLGLYLFINRHIPSIITKIEFSPTVLKEYSLLFILMFIFTLSSIVIFICLLKLMPNVFVFTSFFSFSCIFVPIKLYLASKTPQFFSESTFLYLVLPIVSIIAITCSILIYHFYLSKRKNFSVYMLLETASFLRGTEHHIFVSFLFLTLKTFVFSFLSVAIFNLKEEVSFLERFLSFIVASWSFLSFICGIRIYSASLFYNAMIFKSIKKSSLLKIFKLLGTIYLAALSVPFMIILSILKKPKIRNDENSFTRFLKMSYSVFLQIIYFFGRPFMKYNNNFTLIYSSLNTKPFFYSAKQADAVFRKPCVGSVSSKSTITFLFIPFSIFWSYFGSMFISKYSPINVEVKSWIILLIYKLLFLEFFGTCAQTLIFLYGENPKIVKSIDPVLYENLTFPEKINSLNDNQLSPFGEEQNLV